MRIEKHKTDIEAGRAAAEAGAAVIRAAIQERGEAVMVVPTGASQLHMHEAFVVAPDIAWDKVTVFHLDEYVGLPITHPASFRKYLWERFYSKLPLPVKAFHYVNGEADPQEECRRLNALISSLEVDLCFAGIGENGHLAFNDPPADFETEDPYIVVALDEGCRKQQFGEGWFPSLEAVPEKAISMSVRQVMKARHIVCAIPDDRKAAAVQRALEGPVCPEVPASILQKHPNAVLHLDAAAASLLKN